MRRPIYIAWSEEKSLGVTFKIRHEGGEGTTSGKKGIGCSSQREQHVQRLVGEKILASSRHRKVVSVIGTLVKGQNKCKGQQVAGGMIRSLNLRPILTGLH